MDSIPKRTPAETEAIRQLFHQRYQEKIDIQLANPTLLLDLKCEQQTIAQRCFNMRTASLP